MIADQNEWLNRWMANAVIDKMTRDALLPLVKMFDWYSPDIRDALIEAESKYLQRRLPQAYRMDQWRWN